MADREKITDSIMTGAEMLLEKLSTISRSKDKWTMQEMGCLADILKDVSESYKNVAKAEMIFSSHSPEKY
ncbi:MAG: hypothetical protein J6S85_02125 [Methanobrevibacter sp.]|nr:hypothetical protein [Methanobrevibacter sp.]MBO7712334.1 hypothetical protein [Methanobrevibacter sp.]